MLNSSIKSETFHQDVQADGGSRGTSRMARRGRRSGPYDAWTIVELRKRAKELGMKGYSVLPKDDLITALRNQ